MEAKILSFSRQLAEDLGEISWEQHGSPFAAIEADIAAKRVGRWVTRIGSERIEQVEQQAREFESLPLPFRQKNPVDVTPELVCIQCDGGRLQIRPRNSPADDSRDSPTFWRESKVGTLIKMAGKVYEQDPCPKIPNIFIDSQRISRLTQEIKGFSGDSGDSGDSVEPVGKPVAHSTDRFIEPDELHASTRPKPLVRSVIATTKNVEQFGRLIVGEAYQRGFLAASRKAFVCDGMACNWTLQEKHFPRFTPILDFVHAICYVYHAAIGGLLSEVSWSRYCVWAQLLWSGEIDKLLEQMKFLQNEIGKPTEEDGDTSPRQAVGRQGRLESVGADGVRSARSGPCPGSEGLGSSRRRAAKKGADTRKLALSARRAMATLAASAYLVELGHSLFSAADDNEETTRRQRGDNEETTRRQRGGVA